MIVDNQQHLRNAIFQLTLKDKLDALNQILIIEGAWNWSIILLEDIKKLIDHFECLEDRIGLIDIGLLEQYDYEYIEQFLIRKHLIAAVLETFGVAFDLSALHFDQKCMEQFVIPWKIMPFDVFAYDAYVFDFFH